jgi:hypothetical protein
VLSKTADQLRQVSPKSDFAFSFSGVLCGGGRLPGLQRPFGPHRFVRDCWDAEVSDFQEYDFVPVTAAD